MNKNVYICTSDCGYDSGTIRRIRQYAIHAKRQGFTAVVPQFLFPLYYISKPGTGDSRPFALPKPVTVSIASCCQLWVCSETITGRMNEEIKNARDNNIPVVFFDGHRQGVF